MDASPFLFLNLVSVLANILAVMASPFCLHSRKFALAFLKYSYPDTPKQPESHSFWANGTGREQNIVGDALDTPLKTPNKIAIAFGQLTDIVLKEPNLALIPSRTRIIGCVALEE
jgi:hypothetical protein